jgi:hypothetical protein
MRLKLATLIFVASCLPALAQPGLSHRFPAQGSAAVVEGRAYVERGAQGTYIHVDDPRLNSPVTGFVPFGSQSRDLWALDGRRVQMAGVLFWDGRPKIVISDPRQLMITG